MFGFDEAKKHRDDLYDNKIDPQEHESSFLHEAVAGGAAFEAMKLWEDHQRKNGEVVKHGFAKEMLAGLAAAEVDKLAETKGMDYLDREKAKHHAKEQAEHLYEQQHGGYDEYNPNQNARHQTMDY